MTNQHASFARKAPQDGSLFIQRAKELLPVLRERAPGTERLGKVDDLTIQDFHKAGFFKMFQSAYWGGYESHPADIFAVQEILAQGCPSSAWIMGVVGVHNWQLAHFPLAAQREVWGDDPTVLISSSYAPTGTVTEREDGCILRGKWLYSSGVDHADWILVGGNIVREGADFPDYRTYLVPRSDFTIIEDWNVLGLKGTGSKSVEIQEAFVPNYRQLPFVASQAFATPGMVDGTADGALFQVPFPTIFGACITTPALGAAQAIHDLYVEMTGKATSLYTGDRWAAEQITQIRLAESEGELRAARLQMRQNFNDIIDSIVAGEVLDLAERARYRFDHCNLVDLAFRAADRLYVASGARSLMLDQPLQRYYRDILSARVHAINNRAKWAAVYGRCRLGDFDASVLGMFI